MQIPLRGGMLIFIKTLTGKVYELEAEPGDTIERIKMSLERQQGML
jgi:hypothetical protein